MTEAVPKLTRRRFLAGTAATAAALALPFNRALMPSAAAKDADTLTIGLPAAPNALAATAAYLAAFTKSTGIKITPFTTNTTSGTWVAVFQEISTRLAGGEPMDSAYIATEGMLLFEERGVIEPLDSYIASDKAAVDAFYQDVNPQLLANFRTLDTLKGHTYFIPIGYNVMSIWYSKALFKKYNVPTPAPGWTWADFEAAATKIADAPNRYGFAINASPGPFTDVYPWILTAGGQVFTPDQSKCVVDNPPAVQAATFVRSLVEKKLVNSPGGAYNAFAEAAAGRLGMFGGGIWPNLDITATQAQINQDFGIVPWPVLKQGATSGTPVGVGGFPIFKGSKNKDALWEFIKFTFSTGFQSGAVVPFGGDMPIRQSVATSSAFLAKFPPGTDNFSKELSNSTMIVGVPNGSAVENEIGVVWEQILTGATSPAAGMKSMQDNVAQLMTQSV
jgi:multiple sugar transport system substrate-binding protein